MYGPIKKFSRNDMRTEFPRGSGYYRQIPHPPFTTLCIQCPACGTPVDTWCYPDREDPNCVERVEMYCEITARYVDGIKSGRFGFPCFQGEDKELIEKLIKEVTNEQDSPESNKFRT